MTTAYKCVAAVLVCRTEPAVALLSHISFSIIAHGTVQVHT
jgi:hypothetical protein